MQLLHAGPAWLWALVAGILITTLLVLGFLRPHRADLQGAAPARSAWPACSVKLLVFVAVINGVAAAAFLVVVMRISGSRRLMGDYVNGNTANILGWLTATLMAARRHLPARHRGNRHLTDPKHSGWSGDSDASRSALRGVLGFPRLQLELAGCLARSSFSLQPLISGGLAGLLLSLALDYFRLVLGLLAQTHDRLPSCPRAATLPGVAHMDRVLR
jgi:hypothetical protein